MLNTDLSEREKSILRYVIHQFILTANPVGSRNISKKYDLGLSPATIRNIMADLEDTGLLGHPHTSAGRVPTDNGYRFYVDSLMGTPKLGRADKRSADKNIDSKKADDLVKATSSILSDITNQLALITYPKISNSILEKIQIVRLSSSRVLVVVTVMPGIVKTITLELQISVQQSKLNSVQRILNQRLSGLKFSEIRNSIADRIRNFKAEELKPIIRVFLESADKIFNDEKSSGSVISGAKNILTQPEFEDIEKFQSIIELVEDRDVIVHVMDKYSKDDSNDVSITIGSENEEKKFMSYSLITKEYKVGSGSGTVGIIGPKRMEYSKVVAAVEYVARLLSKELVK
ncbi:MAG: heat-inducible transcriptional repressor HrcA [Bacteroidota bacterium]